MAGSKRAAGNYEDCDVVDLTQDEPFSFPASSRQPNAKVPRLSGHASSSEHVGLHTPPSSSQPGYRSSQVQPSSQFGRFDDDEFDDNVIDELVEPTGTQELAYSSSAMTMFQLYGTMAAKIVGVRYYNGIATPGEMVVLRREPDNPYDRNAIQVLNAGWTQIGHIPRQVAMKLAKYMDNRSLLVEGIITGEKMTFDCPINLRLYGTTDPVERLGLLEQMKADRLPLDEQKRREKMERDRAKAAKAAQKAKNKGGANGGPGGAQWEHGQGGLASGSQGGLASDQSFEDIIRGSERFNPRNIEEVVEQFGVTEDELKAMPMAKQPAAISAELLPFQLQGLQWLLDKENPTLPKPGSADYVQCWKRSTRDTNIFTNVVTNYSLKGQLPELASGGLLCDDMGLGKTLQIISLIMADRANSSPNPGISNATLILAPMAVMSNWSSQIKRHVKEECALNVMIYHSTRKQPIDPKTIGDYDVVVTTYDTMMHEYFSKKGQDVPRAKGLFSVRWRRIVLDEGHNIRNQNAKRAVAACHLLAQSRWILTGTPIVNSLKDLYSLVKFLRLSGGLDRFELFNAALIRPVNHGDQHGSFLLQLLMKGICLRRKKDMKFVDLKLPELSEYVHKIQFAPHEKEKYDALEAEAKGKLDMYRQTLGTKSKDSAQEYRHLLEVLLRIRQCCNHWRLVGEKRITQLMELLDKEGAVSLTPENKKALEQMLLLNIEGQEDCPVCIDPLKDPVITTCAHVFCYGCIERVIETQHKCPMCRADLQSANTCLVRPPKESKTEVAEVDDSTSSKIDALLQILRASSQKNPGEKTVLFSQWTSFLDIVQKRLADAGYSFTRLDGSMPALERDKALDKFESDAECTILLASLGVCSVGLNLVAANQVILMDTWWAPAIEDQAVDRVHRLGQKRECRVWRLVMEGSIEEKVLDIQEDKRRLMALAFAERVEKEKQRKGLQDISRLLS